MNARTSGLRRRSLGLRRLRAACLSLAFAATLALTAEGCAIATLTGFATGALTGMVDAPAQVYRYNRGEFDRHPEWWSVNILGGVPVGFMAGPLVGLVKGIAIDVQWWLLDYPISYERVFGAYRDESIWRPFTIHW